MYSDGMVVLVAGRVVVLGDVCVVAVVGFGVAFGAPLLHAPTRTDTSMTAISILVGGDVVLRWRASGAPGTVTLRHTFARVAAMSPRHRVVRTRLAVGGSHARSSGVRPWDSQLGLTCPR